MLHALSQPSSLPHHCIPSLSKQHNNTSQFATVESLTNASATASMMTDAETWLRSFFAPAQAARTGQSMA